MIDSTTAAPSPTVVPAPIPTGIRVASTRYHTAVLDDIPEDTDVFHVLTRRPSVPEYVMTDAFLYAISTKCDIRILDRRPVTPRGERASAQVPR